MKAERAVDKGGKFSYLEQGKFNFIDVRRPEEYNAFHLEGALDMPVEDLERTFGDLDKKKPTLLYCRTGKRCLKAAEILADKGLHEIFVLEGGLDGYREYLKGMK
jgi:rhodanese-related sulfurtransferase